METFECKICDYVTNRSNDLKKHEKTQKHLRRKYAITYENKNDFPIECSECSLIAKSDKISCEDDKNFIIDDKNSQIYDKKLIIDDKNSHDESLELIEKKQTKKDQNFICDCGRHFTFQSNLSRHKKTCDILHSNNVNGSKTSDTQAMEILKLKQQVAEMTELIKHIGVTNTNSNNNNVNKLCSDNTINNNMVNSNNKISVIAYLNSNYNEAPPIKMLEKSDITKIFVSDKLGDHSIAEWIAFENKHCRLHDFLGDFILKEFKKNDQHKQQVFISDIPRLKFIVRHALGKDTSTWQNDPRGICLTKYIITPMLDEVKLICIEYIDTNKIKMKSCDMDQFESLDACSKSAFDTIYNINEKILHKKILRYIAPYFHLELLDDVDENDKPKLIEI